MRQKETFEGKRLLGGRKPLELQIKLGNQCLAAQQRSSVTFTSSTLALYTPVSPLMTPRIPLALPRFP